MYSLLAGLEVILLYFIANRGRTLVYRV